jgi:hypothetical protein
MASKRRLRRLSCTSKRRYARQADAVAAMIRFLNKHPNENVATYRCRFGDHWHFGHMPQHRA